MGLPQRVFYPVHEIATRWGCSVSDVAGWAEMGQLRIVTGIPPVECGEWRAGGLVQVEPMDILPMFRSCGTGPREVRLHRVRPIESDEWLYITAPADGVCVSIGEIMIFADEVRKFEDLHDLFGRIAGGAGLGDKGDYDWEAMNAEITRRVFEEGLPESQGAWIRELQEWFAAKSDTGDFPDEKSIRLRLAPILRALKFRHPKR